jgi:perosamine synthetase
MMIPVSRPCVTDADVDAVADILRQGFVSGDAPIVAEFEKAFAAAVHREHGIAVSNGSVALDLALHALDLEAGDEVIIPSFTIASCLFAVLRTKATPVFIDVDPLTWNLSAATLHAAITPRTRALLAVHIYGLPIDMDPVVALCDKHQVVIIEDAAESHTVTYNGKLCGSFGLASTFSFYANKAITTGEGGMIVTDDANFAQRLRGLRNLAFLPAPGPRFVHEEIGWNARLSALQAALGKSQLQRMNEVTAEKRRIGLAYHNVLADHPLIQMQPTETSYSRNMYWVVGLILAEPLDARQIANLLRDRGVDTRPFFYPLHKQPMLSKYSLDSQPSLPVAERLGNQGLYLPSFVGITDAEVGFCAQQLIAALHELQP